MTPFCRQNLPGGAVVPAEDAGSRFGRARIFPFKTTVSESFSEWHAVRYELDIVDHRTQGAA
jgi:hypothetical protein